MTTAALNRSAIMSAAWAAVNDYRARGFVKCASELRQMLSRELRKAWAAAKNAAYRAATANQTPVEQARAALSMLENKDRWNEADRKEADRLRGVMHGANADDYAEKRELIASAGGRFCSVVFIKADGTERTMIVQPAKLAKHVKGDDATDAGKKAVATRKARHPNLLPVWDVAAQAPRSINLATVQTITVDGLARAYG